MTKSSPNADRILLVEFFARGGLLHYSWQLAEGLARARPGAAVALLTGRRPEFAGAPAGARLLPRLWTWNPHRRVARRWRRLVRLWRGLRYLAAWAQILWIARRQRPGVILFGDLEHRCDAWGIARLRRGPWRLAAIWHNVAPFERHRRGRLVRHTPWRDRLVGQFDAVFVHGQQLARQLEAQSGVRATVIAHGNQAWMARQSDGGGEALARRLALPEGAPVALLFGSLTQYKGIPVLLEALARLAPAERPITVIAGLPTADLDLAALRRQAEQAGVAEWVRWVTDYIPAGEVGAYFTRADWVVLPYLAASQSGVAHLALTFGKPLIVTATGSLPELIAGNGLVVGAGDAGALAAALAALAGNPRRRRAMGQRSAQLAASGHDWTTIAAEIWAVLQ